MPVRKFQDKYRIDTARATWHDYNGGAYFITVCTKNKEHFFGKITTTVPMEMQLTLTGQYLHDNLQNVTTHYPYAEIPLFVVMPNHWHAIVFIHGDETARGDGACGDGARRDGARIDEARPARPVSTGRLSVVIGGIKSAVTRFANKNNIDFAWQTRFHDHIIRDQKQMNRIADYIENNPATWGADCFNL